MSRSSSTIDIGVLGVLGDAPIVFRFHARALVNGHNGPRAVRMPIAGGWVAQLLLCLFVSEHLVLDTNIVDSGWSFYCALYLHNCKLEQITSTRPCL